jgi:hypothetical protein
MWRPAEGRMPAGGNAVYLESETGDYIGAGKAYLYTGADTLFSVTPIGAGLRINLTGDEDWSGEFVPPNTQSRLQPGYYGSLARYPFHNPVNGGMEWSGEGRGCNTLAGWFIVDSVSYEGSALSAIDLRFEQRCEGGSSALRGKIKWRADDGATSPGPVNPAPTGLWAPAAGATPASGNFVYLSSMPGDYIGGGMTRSFTDANALLKVTATGARLQVSVNGDSWWSGDFAGMNTLGRLQPGYYGNLQRYPFHNPIRGGLSWSGDGRGCNTLSGWFAVDKVSYVQDQLSEIDLRFQQHCEGVSAALRGRIRWSAAAAP